MSSSKITSLKFDQDESSTDELPQGALGFLSKLLNEKTLLLKIGLATLCLLVALAFMNLRRSQLQNASRALVELSISGTHSVEPYSDLRKLLKISNKYRFLQSHIDGPLAQEFVNIKELKHLDKLCCRIEKRLPESLESVLLSNRITQQMVQGQYQKALNASYQLGQSLPKDKLPLMHAYHLLRLIFLENKLGHLELAKQHLLEFELEAKNLELKGLYITALGDLSYIDFLKNNLKIDLDPLQRLSK